MILFPWYVFHLGPVYMRSEWSRSGVKIEIASVFTRDRHEMKKYPQPRKTCNAGYFNHGAHKYKLSEYNTHVIAHVYSCVFS